MNRERMKQQLLLHEGLKLHFYDDTEGNVTVGIGFNVTARGMRELERLLGRQVNATGDIAEGEALAVLDLDITRVEKAVRVNFPEYDSLSEVRQRVVLDLCFNIGFRARGFVKCADAIRKQDWSRAARELHRSHWTHQVEPNAPNELPSADMRVQGRADRLVKMLLTGQDYDA